MSAPNERTRREPMTPEQYEAYTDQRFTRGSERMKKLESQLASLDAAMSKNTTMTREGLERTTEVVDMFNSLKGGFKTLELLGKLAKPLGYVLALIVAGLSAIAGLKTLGWWLK